MTRLKTPRLAHDKRIVVQHTQGPLAGLWRIMGRTSDLKAGKPGPLPHFVEPVDFLDHQGACSLVRSKPRYVLYRELMPPALQSRSRRPSFKPEPA